MVNNFSSSMSILALLKLSIFSARNLVSMDFRLHELVANVRFLTGRFGFEKFCPKLSSLIFVRGSSEPDEWLHAGD